MANRTRQTQLFVGAMAIAGLAGTAYAAAIDHALHIPYALALLGMAALTSRMKAKLPGIEGNMSVNLPFLLMAVVNLSAAEAITIAALSTAVQTWPKKNAKLKPQQMLFNVSMLALATSIASLVWHSGAFSKTSAIADPVMLATATAMFFFGQTAPVAGVIAVSEGTNLPRTWWSIAQLSFPYFVLSAGLTTMTDIVSHHTGWPIAMLAFPVMYAVHRSYRLYFGTVSASTAPLARVAAVGR